jgi:hypothetical protein
VFHRRHRRHPLGETFPWTDYRYSNAPGFPPRVGRHAWGGGWGHPWGGHRRHRTLRKLLIGVALIALAIFVLQRLTGSRRSSNWF